MTGRDDRSRSPRIRGSSEATFYFTVWYAMTNEKIHSFAHLPLNRPIVIHAQLRDTFGEDIFFALARELGVERCRRSDNWPFTIEATITGMGGWRLEWGFLDQGSAPPA